MVYLHCYDARRLGQLNKFSVKLRLSSSVQTRVLGAQKNRITETVVVSTHQIFFANKFWLRNRKNNFLLRTLICRTDELPPLTRISLVLFISFGSLGGQFKEERQKHTKIPSNPSLYKNSHFSNLFFN